MNSGKEKIKMILNRHSIQHFIAFALHVSLYSKKLNNFNQTLDHTEGGFQGFQKIVGLGLANVRKSK